jgi:isoleucyl-tRNA synthetase
MADYKSTLNITQTSFPMKANLPQTEPERLKFWEGMGFYKRMFQKGKAGKFVLHDGPPFANGDIHMGTALNKILKDIIVKYRGLRGHDAPYVPGWDCHGMPIEHKVMEQLGSKARTMSKVEIRGECRKYAEKFMNRQRDEFKRLGILGDFDNPYLTMDPAYELSIVKSFNQMLLEGYVSRRLRPIHWCPKCRTALAEAEVEYADHESLAVTVAFPAKELPKGLFPNTPKEKLSFLIWTTTPWTLPANLGISVHPDFEYVTLQVGDAYYVVAKVLLAQVSAMCGWKATDFKIIDEAKGQDLDRAVARHPFLEQDSLVMVGAHVTAEAGTGLVHTAPGHGREDYEIGMKYQLPVYSPVDEAGKYDARVKEYEGVSVWDANPKIVEKLKGLGRLLSLQTIKHSYPHCWRSKNPIIFRATAQWFVELDHQDLRKKALGQIEEIGKANGWIPGWGKDRIHNMVEGRADWCISRQRSWGVPIAALYCKTCGKVVIDPKVSEAVVALVKSEGLDGWFKHQAQDVLPKGFKCSCGSIDFIKEEDILDVWFESGVSHMAVLETRPELKWPADLYLEGGDQHRGWFQHALWTGMALKGKAPFEGVLTHGWVLDAQGKAMHKSAGNVIDPMDLMKTHGADILRLWVSSEDYTEDVAISQEMLSRMSEAYRRIRNTFRFILGNLSDFDPAKDRVEEKDFLPVDRWAWAESQKTLEGLRAAYEQYQFTKVFHQLDQFFSVTLSAGYFDILKDRLYTFGAASKTRRAAQTVLFDLLKSFVTAIAPILSFTAEEIWQSLPDHFKPNGEKSVFDSRWDSSVSSQVESGLDEEWGWILATKKAVSKSLEGLRQAKTIGSSLEGEVELYVGNEKTKTALKKHLENLRYYFLVSKVDLKEGEAPADAVESEDASLKLRIVTRKSGGQKCARCWNYYPADQMDKVHSDICHRCGPVVKAHPAFAGAGAPP